MDHRHLLPEEIDLLLDGEEGFGVTPLKAHLASCAGCRAEFDAQYAVVQALEGVPHFAPSPRFADRVMARVEIFEPWHVAARETVRRWFPRTQGGRALVVATGGVMAVTMTLLTVWLATRADAVLFVASLAGQRVRDGVTGALHGLVVSTLGESAASAVVANGILGIAVALSLMAVAIFGTALGLKTLATAARSRRS